MRILPLILLCACTSGSPDTGAAQQSAWTPDAPWGGAEVPEQRVLVDGLDSPTGLAQGFGALWIAETGAGRIWHHDGQELTLSHEGLDAPSELAATVDGVVIIDGDEVLQAQGSELGVLASELQSPHAPRTGHQSIWWVETGTGNDGRVWRSDSDGVAVVADGLETPQGLALIGERAVVAETGNWRLLQIAENQAPQALATIGGTIRDVGADCEDLFFITESTRWPYPGFVATLSSGEQHNLSESPPEPERMLVLGDQLIWSTKQSIHSVSRDGGTFRTLAQRTAVGEMVIWADTLIWTNPERGEVLAVDL